MRESVVEVKFRIPEEDWGRLLEVLEKLANFVRDVNQRDTFYEVAYGLLKLRRSSDKKHTLIWYRRADTPQIKSAESVKCLTRDPDELNSVLAMALPTIGKLEKNRSIYRLGRVEIHLDEIVGLGRYLELETILGSGEDEALGETMVRSAVWDLGISGYAVEGLPYFKLLATNRGLGCE